uniref:collagen alpha-6(VI) chain-like isoform X2 n=1 Tax=Myxine glutinosa TaxID=7769 RepID=UPI00358F65CA
MDIGRGSPPVARAENVAKGLISRLDLSQTSCPRGARVSLLGYRQDGVISAKRLSEITNHKTLLARLSSLVASSAGGPAEVGKAMLHVARHSFKRIRAGPLVRRMAVFIVRSTPKDMEAARIGAALLAAADVTTLILTFGRLAELEQAIKVDVNGHSQLVHLTGDIASKLNSTLTCTLCFDHCDPHPECPGKIARLLVEGMQAEVAFMLDGTLDPEMRSTAKGFLRLAMELPQSTRSALVLYPHPPGFDRDPVKSPVSKPVPAALALDFDDDEKKRSDVLAEELDHMSGSPVAGTAKTLQWLLGEVFKGPAKGKRKRALVVVTAARDSAVVGEAKSILNAALKLKCNGVAVFVVGLGPRANVSEMMVVASDPTEFHIVPLMNPGNNDYLTLHFRTFLTALDLELFNYPKKALAPKCREISARLKDSRQNDESSIPWHSPAFKKEICQEKPVEGPCQQLLLKWYYNPVLRQCGKFWYSGCGGNYNRFTSQFECLKACYQLGWFHKINGEHLFHRKPVNYRPGVPFPEGGFPSFPEGLSMLP